jgi:hypothetical protein
MRDASAQMGNSRKASQPGLRRRPIVQAAEPAAAAGKTESDISHLIGFGILLTAALLIAIGSFGTSTPSDGASATAEAGVYAPASSPGPRR